jgi:hypothetical protein
VSKGQSALEPVHVSATSQTPFFARQTVVSGLKVFEPHVPDVPSHTPAFSQTPLAAAHTVPAGSF